MKDRLSNALVKIKANGEFVTSILNTKATPRTICYNIIQVELISHYLVNIIIELVLFTNSNKRQAEIIKVLRLDHLNEEEPRLIQEFCLEFFDIFYLEGNHLSFTTNHSIVTQNAKRVFFNYIVTLKYVNV